MLNRVREIYLEFPKQFWVVVGVSFIDRIGGTILWPFFSLYITQKLNVGMTQADIVLGTFSTFGLIGSMIGGGLTDKFGRKSIIKWVAVKEHINLWNSIRLQIQSVD